MFNTYCVYITIYYGNKFPPFYIGYCKTNQIIKNKYHGSVSSKEYKKIWIKEQKEKPNLFKTIILCTFLYEKDANEKEIYFQRKLNVLNKPEMYVNRCIYPNYNAHTESVRKKLSITHLGNKHTDETKKKMSITRKGKTRLEMCNGDKDKLIQWTTKFSISNRKKRRLESIPNFINAQLQVKIKRQKNKQDHPLKGRYFPERVGKKWYNNGNIEKLFFPSEVPINYVPGMLSRRQLGIPTS